MTPTNGEPRDVAIVRRLAEEVKLNRAAIADLTGIPLEEVLRIHRDHGITAAAGHGKPSGEQRRAAFAAIASIVGINNDQDEALADRIQRGLQAKLPVDIAYLAARRREVELGGGVYVGIRDLQGQAA